MVAWKSFEYQRKKCGGGPNLPVVVVLVPVDLFWVIIMECVDFPE